MQDRLAKNCKDQTLSLGCKLNPRCFDHGCYKKCFKHAAYNADNSPHFRLKIP